MTFTPDQTALLEAPLSKANVKKNPRGYDYVEAWHAIAEANRIFGFDGWTRETVMLTETNCDLVELSGSNGPYKQWRIGYIAKVRVTAGGVIREGTGYGSGMSKPEARGEAVEGAVKEAESDAMKRALMTFGNPFGLALYDKEKTNVSDGRAPANEPIESRGRKSSAQATRDGDHTKYIARIDKASLAQLDAMEEAFDQDTAEMPRAWLDPMRDKIALRREELTAPKVEAAEEMDEAFRQTMGGAGSGGLANSASKLAAA